MFDRNTSGLAIGRVAVSTAGQPDIVKREPFRPDLLPSLSFFRGDREIKIGDLSPTEIPPDLGFLTAVYVLKNLNSDDDFRVQHIRVPSNEFHRRIATVVLLLTSIWLIFSYLGTDFHLRRPPVWGYVVIGSVVTLSLLCLVLLWNQLRMIQKIFGGFIWVRLCQFRLLSAKYF